MSNRKRISLIADLLQKNNIKAKILTEEELEDYGLLKLMFEVDLNDTVSEESEEIKKQKIFWSYIK